MLFLHIAKTGGQSIRKMLRQELNSFDCIHNGALLEFRQGSLYNRRQLSDLRLQSYDLAFFMVRHPLERLISCYHYFIQGGLNQFQKVRFPHDQQLQQYLQENAPTFRDCCLKLPEVAAIIPHMNPISKCLSLLPIPLAKEVWIGRYETFEIDTVKLFHHLGLKVKSASLPRLNRTRPGWIKPDIDPIMLSRVNDFYSEDFCRFDYTPGFA